MSPTSLKLTKRQLEEGANKSLNECLKMEFRLMVHCLERERDFYEGVRALLVDRDQNPKWKPKILSEVSDSSIEYFFEKLSDSEELKL